MAPSTTHVKMPAVRLAWAVAWPAFWTGLPIKLVVALLVLAAGGHPWEGTGLAVLLVVSIPIDIWAVGLTARTVFLERLGVEIKGPVGPVLWWQGAALGAGVLAAGYYLLGATVSIGKQAAAGIIGLMKMIYPDLPIAEQITIELVLWSFPAAIAALLLLLVWLKLFGWRIRSFVLTAGTASATSYQERVRRWDYSRIPADPALMLGSLAGVAVILTLMFWLFLPSTTPHPHEHYPQPEASKPSKPVKPEEVLKQTETTLAQAAAVLQALEEEHGKDQKKAERKGK